MQKLMVGFVLMLAVQANALVMNWTHYDAKTQELRLNMTYTGGCMDHEFSLLMDPCQEDGTAARLIDSGGDDTCKEIITSTATIDMSSYQCKPGVLTIFWGRNQHVSVEIKD